MVATISPRGDAKVFEIRDPLDHSRETAAPLRTRAGVQVDHELPNFELVNDVVRLVPVPPFVAPVEYLAGLGFGAFLLLIPNLVAIQFASSVVLWLFGYHKLTPRLGLGRSVGDGVIAADPEGRVKYLNPVAEKLTGWTLAQAAGKEIEQVFQIVHETTGKPVEQPVRKVIERGITVGPGNHTLLIARNGSERAIDDCAAPIKDDGGNVAGVVLIFRDITQRRQTEQLIESAREYAESIVATVREPLIILDSELHVRSANRSFGHHAT